MSEGEVGPRFKHVPGKGVPVKNDSPFLHAVLALIHGVFYSYSSLRAIVGRLYSTFSSFILTSSSKELIKSDISTLNKIPSHLAVIVTERDLEKLVHDVADLTAWSICSSISVLTIYEAEGILKGMDTSLQIAIKRKIRRYFREMKRIAIHTPAWGSTSNNYGDDLTGGGIPDLEINIISREDGREAILDLTRSLCRLVAPKSKVNGAVKTSSPLKQQQDPHNPQPQAENGRTDSPRNGVPSHSPTRSESPRHSNLDTEKVLKSSDITIPFLDAHLTTSTIPEPNLLLIFSTDRVLAGFPPWSMRLCEISYVGRSGRVSYRGFLKGLQQYGRAEMRFGS